MRLDFHALAELRVARRDERAHALHLDGAGPARAIRIHAVIMAERRDLDADLAQRLVDREAVDELMRLAVDGYLKHGSTSVG